jgi:hypothetical protein
MWLGSSETDAAANPAPESAAKTAEIAVDSDSDNDDAKPTLEAAVSVEYFCTFSRGLGATCVSELKECFQATDLIMSDGKIYFATSQPTRTLAKLKSVERVFMLVGKKPASFQTASSVDKVMQTCLSFPWATRIARWKDESLGLNNHLNDIEYFVSCKLNRPENWDPRQLARELSRTLEGRLGLRAASTYADNQLNIWLQVTGRVVLVGLQLFSKHALSRRTYLPHLRLRPTVAYAMARLALSGTDICTQTILTQGP